MKWRIGCHKNFFKKYKTPHKQTKNTKHFKNNTQNYEKNSWSTEKSLKYYIYM